MGPGVNSGRGFLHGAWKAAKMPVKPPKPGETGRLVSFPISRANRLGAAVGRRMGRAFSPPIHGEWNPGALPQAGMGRPVGPWEGRFWNDGGLAGVLARALGKRVTTLVTLWRGLGGDSCQGSGETSEDTRYNLAGALRSAAGVARSSSIRFCFGFEKLAGRLVHPSAPDRRRRILPHQPLNPGRERLMRRDLISLCRNWSMP